MPYLAKKPWSWATQRGATRKFIAAWAMTTFGFAAAARTFVQPIREKHRHIMVAEIFAISSTRDKVLAEESWAFSLQGYLPQRRKIPSVFIVRIAFQFIHPCVAAAHLGFDLEFGTWGDEHCWSAVNRATYSLIAPRLWG